MRKFHNQVKLIYLNKYVKDFVVLLDLASGKGGDIYKWNMNKFILKVDGYDINKDSVKEAIRRRNVKRIRKRMNFKTLDLSTNVIECIEKYGVITSMFAFHYFFKSDETLQTILKTIDNCSKKGTLLIMTLFDGSLIKKSIEGRNFYIRLSDGNDLRKKTGNKLDVFIKESVLDKPETEYLVYPKKLIQVLKTINFHFVEKTNFKELYNDMYKLNEEELVLSFLNNVYVFEKK